MRFLHCLSYIQNADSTVCNGIGEDKDKNDNDCKRYNRKNRNATTNNRKSLPSSKDTTTRQSHSFDFPTQFCGQLIGRRGHNVGLIKEKCGVEIVIRPKMYDTAWQVVTLEGQCHGVLLRVLIR